MTLSLIAMFLPGKTYAQELYKLVPDSAYLHVYNSESASWDFSGALYYYGEPGYVDSTVTTSSDRTPVSKSFYQYENGFITDGLTQVHIAGEWLNSQHQVFFYDTDQLVERIVTKWTAGEWQNLNRFTYFYDQEEGYLEVYNREIWKNSIWTDYSADSLFYDDSGKVVLRSARLKSSKVYITRTLYFYNIYGKKTSQVRQDWINSEWINVTRTSYYYNKCGIPTTTETEKWSNESWQPDSRSEIFYHVEIAPGTVKVPVCNKGNTRYVSINALDGFLLRGACVGECIEENPETIASAKRETTISKVLPFVVYPNPAREWVTVKMASDDCSATEIVLLDYSGRLIQAIDPGDRPEISIDLSNLKSGNYILKVTSDEVYSTVISKQ